MSTEKETLKNSSSEIKENLIVIAGPTGVGKTEISLEIAKYLNTQILSADSMQIYREMDIGTAKNKTKDPIHHMIDIIDPDESFSAYEFQKSARYLIKKINSQGYIPMMVGGTGLYINSIVYDLEFKDKRDSLRSLLNSYCNKFGTKKLYDILLKKDKTLAEKIDENNRNRIIRALEITLSGEKKETKNFRTENDNLNLLYFGLYCERSILYDKINKRVEKMIDLGLINEVKSLLDRGLSINDQSMRAIGYKEVIRYLNKEISHSEMIYEIKKNTRHFAKRQLTWFKPDNRIIWIDVMDKPLEKMLNIIGDKFGLK